MSAGNVTDGWEARAADELPTAFGAAATEVFDFYHTRVFLPNAVAISGLAFGAGIEFGATPAVSDDAVADFVAAAGVNSKNVDGVVTNSPLSGVTTPPGGQDFWLYVRDSSAGTADDRRTRRIAARLALLNSVR